jgi:hypothetical protein
MLFSKTVSPTWLILSSQGSLIDPRARVEGL